MPPNKDTRDGKTTEKNKPARKTKAEPSRSAIQKMANRYRKEMVVDAPASNSFEDNA